ncbi:MAG: hypothetical protein RSD40_03440 [Bacilli bacterium]
MYNLTFEDENELELHNVAKQGFINFFEENKRRYEENWVTLSAKDFDFLINNVAMSYMIKKYGKYTLDNNTLQAFKYICQQIEEVIKERPVLEWLRFKMWDKELVDMIVNVIYKNFEYKYLETKGDK